MSSPTATVSHFCAGIFTVRDAKGKYKILGVTAKRFPNEVKLFGGTNNNAQWESKEETFLREAGEETGLKPLIYDLIHTEVCPGRHGRPDHTKYFYDLKQVEGHFDGPKNFTDTDGDELFIRFWDLEEFHQKLFRNHRIAFLKACARLRKVDESFEYYYPGICRQLDGG